MRLRQSALKLDAIDATGDIAIVTARDGRMRIDGVLVAPRLDAEGVKDKGKTTRVDFALH